MFSPRGQLIIFLFPAGAAARAAAWIPPVVSAAPDSEA